MSHKSWVVGWSAVLCVASLAWAQGTAPAAAPLRMAKEQMPFQPAPPTMPPGTRIAVLEGNPQAEGPVILRVRVKKGAVLPPHTHPRDERVVVIAGAVKLALTATDTVEARAHAVEVRAPGYYKNPAGVPHMVWAEEDTELHIHVDGPWRTEPVKPQPSP